MDEPQSATQSKTKKSLFLYFAKLTKMLPDVSSPSKISGKLLVVSAWEPELTRFRELASGLSLTNASHSQTALGTAAVGIGLVDATLGITRLLLERDRTGLAVVFVGTAGASPRSGLQIHDVIAGREVRLGDDAIARGHAALVREDDAIVTLDERLQSALVSAGAKSASIVNTIGVTTDDDVARRLAALGEVEHLEAFGVARACARFDVPCAIALGISNIVGAKGRDEWRAHHLEASKRAAELVVRAMREIGPS